MADLTKLLQHLQSNDDSSSSSDDDDVAAGLLSMMAQDNPVAKLMASLAVLEGIKDALGGDSGGIRTGDMVKMLSDEATVRKLQEGHGGWNPDMSRDLGKIGCVVRTAMGEDIVTHFGNKTWRLNPSACAKLDKEEKRGMFKFGDQIYVEFTDKIAKEMQKSHGGWDPLMESDLQKVGKVIGTDDDGDVAVQFWTRCWRMNSAACKVITTETGCSFKKGDKVFMDTEVDIGVLKAIQESHRAWTPNIARALGKIGEVEDIDKDGDLIVNIKGKKWALHPDLCTKITSMKVPGGDFFGIGETVSIGVDMGLLKDMQTDHGEWNDDMAKAAGKEGKIVRTLPNGDLYVDFGDKKWRLNAAACTRHGDPRQRGPNLKVGRRITIDLPPEKFLELQLGHGGINASMITDIGKVGKILNIDDDRDIMVQFSPNMWWLNPAICTKLSEVPKPHHSEGDRVYVGLDSDLVESLQEGHGGFVDTMYRLLGQVGRVCRVLPNEDIAVRYGILPMVLHPAIITSLTTVDINGKSSSPVTFNPFSQGDLVRIDMDIINVKKLQEGHGGWTNEMLEFHGKVGIVDRVDSSGSIYVCYGQKFARLNPAVCTPIRSDQVQDNTRPNTTLSGQGQAGASAGDTTRDSSAVDNKCGKCEAKEITVVFGCGHGACHSCNKKLISCPDCQAQITYRTKVTI